MVFCEGLIFRAHRSVPGAGAGQALSSVDQGLDMGKLPRRKAPRDPHHRGHQRTRVAEPRVTEQPRLERIVTDASPGGGTRRNATAQKETLANSTSLDTEIVRADGATISEARRVSSEQMKRAQSIITRAIGKDTAIQMDAIDEAIASLYPYKPKPSQRDALHYLIYSLTGNRMVLLLKVDN
jgi:hypothetical protein